MGHLVDAVPALCNRHDPLEALRQWFLLIIDYAQIERGVIAAIETSVWHQLHDTEHRQMDQALEQLRDAGRRLGDVRNDVDATDVVLLLGGLLRVTPSQWDHRANTLVHVIFDGLRNS